MFPHLATRKDYEECYHGVLYIMREAVSVRRRQVPGKFIYLKNEFWNSRTKEHNDVVTCFELEDYHVLSRRAFCITTGNRYLEIKSLQSLRDLARGFLGTSHA
jgi:hypothetical protein